MTKLIFPQPPEDEVNLKNWRKDIHENLKGKLDGENIQNIDDPGNTTDVTDVAVKLNLLLAELRTLGIM